MRKPTLCICKNNSAYQLCSNCEADQHLCFCYTDSTVVNVGLRHVDLKQLLAFYIKSILRIGIRIIMILFYEPRHEKTGLQVSDQV